MKKFILCVMLVITGTAHANPSSFGQFLLGATVGYYASSAINNKQTIYLNGTPVYNIPQPRVYVQPQQVYVQPQQIYVQPQQVYVQPQIERTPIYEKRSQYDFDCQCYITVNNQIGWQ